MKPLIMIALFAVSLLTFSALAHDDHEHPDPGEWELSEVQIEQAEDITVLGMRTQTTFAEIGDVLDPMIQAVFAAAYAPQPPVGDGPLMFFYDGINNQDMSQPFQLTVGIEMVDGADPEALIEGVSAYTFESARVAKATCTGSVMNLHAAWTTLVEQVQAAGEIPTNNGREVYIDWVGEESNENVIELVVVLASESE